MKRTEAMWFIAVSSKRSEWLREETASHTRKEAWQKMLDLYSEAFRDPPAGDPARMQPGACEGFDRFHEDIREGRIRAVRASVSFEAQR